MRTASDQSKQVVGDSVVAQDVAVVPKTLDDGCGLLWHFLGPEVQALKNQQRL
jgi:hypothetical protein